MNQNKSMTDPLYFTSGEIAGSLANLTPFILAIVFKPRDKQLMRCKCCGSVMVPTEILKPSRGP